MHYALAQYGVRCNTSSRYILGRGWVDPRLLNRAYGFLLPGGSIYICFHAVESRTGLLVQHPQSGNYSGLLGITYFYSYLLTCSPSVPTG